MRGVVGSDRGFLATVPKPAEREWTLPQGEGLTAVHAYVVVLLYGVLFFSIVRDTTI